MFLTMVVKSVTHPEHGSAYYTHRIRVSPERIYEHEYQAHGWIGEVWHTDIFVLPADAREAQRKIDAYLRKQHYDGEVSVNIADVLTVTS